MTIKLPSLLIAATAALAGGCATGGTGGAATASSEHGDRDAVVRCYANGYRKRSGVAPVLDEKTDVAAEQLLKKYEGNTKRACEAVTSALGTASCGGGSTLSSVVACDHRLGREPEIDPATKNQIESRVREHDQQQNSPGGRGL